MTLIVAYDDVEVGLTCQNRMATRGRSQVSAHEKACDMCGRACVALFRKTQEKGKERWW